MQTAKATERSQEGVVSTLNPEQFQQLATVLTITLEPMLRAAMADVMTVKEFAKTSGISESLVRNWLSDGTLIRAPAGKVSEDKARVLINVVAWRERLRQQAVNCRYIHSKA
ncbi:Cro/Cl family transcriptional regulator [Pectobacterium polaris]|uniref:Cro/Cl family transcriptional regulator n=1 Tax=Pectobacterium polaris TaxID=2042057 RepID=A0AAW5GH60_9GAMM|nr:Cro/Cl family transcriptional regulator [Pectobacterium polaris]MCL6353624.1 Cro/Cl family transcriptional regulator [Pectobacterium polaris]MCL6371079.1 Cro/Cl family transcriptional regulator [Pectobacterium polaris]